MFAAHLQWKQWKWTEMNRNVCFLFWRRPVCYLCMFPCFHPDRWFTQESCFVNVSIISVSPHIFNKRVFPVLMYHVKWFELHWWLRPIFRRINQILARWQDFLHKINNRCDFHPWIFKKVKQNILFCLCKNEPDRPCMLIKQKLRFLIHHISGREDTNSYMDKKWIGGTNFSALFPFGRI